MIGAARRAQRRERNGQRHSLNEIREPPGGTVLRVLVADKFSEAGLDELRHAGAEVLYDPDLVDDALAAAVARDRPEVLVVRSTRVTQAVLEAGRWPRGSGWGGGQYH